MIELDVIGFNVMVWREHEHLWIAPTPPDSEFRKFPWVRASYDYAKEFDDVGAAQAAANEWNARYPEDVTYVMAVLASDD